MIQLDNDVDVLETMDSATIMSMDAVKDMELDPLDAFYAQKFYFSYSSLNKLIFSPVAFYNHYVLKQREEKLDRHLVEGKVIHCLILDEASFNKQFIVSPASVPTGNNKMIVDTLFRMFTKGEILNFGFQTCDMTHTHVRLQDLKQPILDLLLKINLHQSFKDEKLTKKQEAEGVIAKTGDEKRLEKILTEENMNYWEYLRTAKGRDVIDQETLEFCKAAADKIKNDPELRNLMGLDVTEFDNIEVVNETEFRSENEDFPFGLKGIVDNLVIDHGRRLIRINDLKTSGKSLADFKESIDYWNYWLQAVIYILLVSDAYRNLFDQGYSVVFRFIVIDRNQQVYPFLVSEETVLKWGDRADELLEKAVYHYSERKYNLPYEFCKGLVVL